MPFRAVRRLVLHNRIPILILILLTLLEIIHHTRSFSVPRPAKPLDEPFSTQCIPPSSLHSLPATAIPPDAHLPLENATIMMLARNADLPGAIAAVRSLEAHWNKHFHYPYVFLNNEPFSATFIAALTAETSGPSAFETIPTHMWSWPMDPVTGAPLIDQTAARRDMQRMASKGLPYANNENYHHMCRFYSGFFQHHPALAAYKFYWRLEPDAHFTCDIPYDVFRSMRENKKRYGYTIALWEVGSTSPSLFRAVSDYKASRALPTRTTWISMHDASWAPWLLRRFLMSLPQLFHSRTRQGDVWNFCHFWSNFEIADLDFFRSAEYTGFFEYLDRKGGFYHERWGDAPVHSLAAGLLLEAEELHWFADVGYSHPPFQNCPEVGVGCRCQCEVGEGGVPDVCLKGLRRGVDP